METTTETPTPRTYPVHPLDEALASAADAAEELSTLSMVWAVRVEERVLAAARAAEGEA